MSLRRREKMSAEHSRGHVPPLSILLPACVPSKSDISISQEWVPETLRLYSYPANQMEEGKEREKKIEDKMEKKKARGENGERRQP